VVYERLGSSSVDSCSSMKRARRRRRARGARA